MRLKDLQEQLKPWVEYNFGEHPSWHALLGVQEEVGELAHAYLKREQKIRGTTEQHNIAIKDAIADTIIFLADFANHEGIDLEETLALVWNLVKQRDWRK